MTTFKLTTDYIELCALLKFTGPSLMGGDAKYIITQGQVLVDGQVETRKKCKIRAGQVVTFDSYVIKVENE